MQIKYNKNAGNLINLKPPRFIDNSQIESHAKRYCSVHLSVTHLNISTHRNGVIDRILLLLCLPRH